MAVYYTSTLRDQTANQGLYDLNVQTGEAIVSPEYARMLGYEPHSFVETNANWLDRMHPRDREGVYQIYKEYIGGLRKDYQVEFRQLTQQGKWKWILSLGKVIEWDPQGRPMRMLGTHTDISDRKAKELALQQNEEALLRAQALAKLGSWRLDLENDVLTWSKETFRIFGVEDDRPLTYEGFLMCVVAEDRERVNRAWQAALQGESYDIEHRIDVRGQIKWLRERAELTRNRTGAPVEVLGTVEDISEHKRAEEEINQARHLLRTVIDATPDWIFVKDRQHRFLLVNQAFANSQGFKPDDMLGKPDTDFWPESVCYGDPAHNIRGLHADDDMAFAGKRIHNPAYQVMLANGQLRWFDTVKLPLRNDNSGEITGIVGYAHDITQQRKVAEELRVSERHQRELRVLAEREQSRMGALLSAMSIGILFEDNQRCVEYVNPAFLRMWGIGEHENLLNKPTRAILECSSEWFAQLDHASKHVLNMPDTHETSERLELELNNGRTLTQLSYPVDDVEGRIIGRLWLYEDITLERQTAQQLLYLAERDPLTGLYNRHRFQEELNNLIAASLRSHQKFALLYFDLDDFKYINDTFGHRAGDTVLVRTAGEISSIVRHIEVFARLGGDEFAILSHLQPGDDLDILPARIVTSISSIPLHFRGTNIRLTTSVGVAVFPEHGETAEDLVAHADTAMYQAKNQGKNTWAIYDPQRDSSEAMMHRLTWYNRIAQALEQNLFEVHFQGVYETAHNALTHLEILVRMRDVDEPGHLIMPGQFIPIAEKNGQIVNIDRWVIRRSIELLSENPAMPPVAINISGRTFDDPSIPQYIRSLLGELQVDPVRLIIELTETAAVSDIQDAQRFIEAVHQAGCRVCLDDFGSGFSTFGYLKYLGVEILKIDGLFIRDLPNNRDNQIFVKAMVEVARGLGKLTVAEFVEDAATLSMVKSLGIDLAQGYYLGRPEAEIPVKS
jgi:diguanylate cyclase (GGDEF)-like protein/PAS domain S-box-containing protein